MTITRWRVAVTRDEDGSGPLSTALRDEGFIPVLCPVAKEGPPADPAPLLEAAAHLDQFDWLICASARAVRALSSARRHPWPRDLRVAAVGARTAAALAEAGATDVFIARDAGAEALWTALARADRWSGRRVLVPAVTGGRQDLIDGLAAAGAHVTLVEAYAMVPRSNAEIAESWRTAAADSAVIASPSAGTRLVEALGRNALQSLRAVVAIGATTQRALRAVDVPSTVPASADFLGAARHLTDLWSSRGDV